MRGSGDREEKAMNGAIHDFHFPGRHAGPPPLPPSLAREGEERAAGPPPPPNPSWRSPRQLRIWGGVGPPFATLAWHHSRLSCPSGAAAAGASPRVAKCHPLLAIAFEAVKGFKSDDSEELGQGKLHKVRCGMACNRDQHDEHKELCGLMSSVF